MRCGIPGAGPDTWRTSFKDQPRTGESGGLPKEHEKRILPAKAQCAWRDKTDGHEILVEKQEAFGQSKASVLGDLFLETH